MLFCWDLAQFQASKFTNQLVKNSQIPSEANTRIIQTCQKNLFSSLTNTDYTLYWDSHGGKYYFTTWH